MSIGPAARQVLAREEAQRVLVEQLRILRFLAVVHLAAYRGVGAFAQVDQIDDLDDVAGCLFLQEHRGLLGSCRQRVAVWPRTPADASRRTPPAMSKRSMLISRTC